ncbi:uncharacterized protein LOC113237912 isoform X2 [Hyposmocoma kahamanoa]|uniref:uncharacterized protein LOC113237912 isoform X2 n=1 Tax=Hyposmocoma kahamanoa TaxID=1477025 RepID=UPI000E6D794D|nr:uncharacterized protein LOC113237912 isoform X2 [Hyposmocoma kahamanoa]
MIFIKILLVLLATVVTLSEDEKTFNLKIGFDLTKGENGMPALRIRDFEESAPHVIPDPKQTRKQNIEKDVAEDKKPKKKRKSEKEGAAGKQSAVVRAEDSSKSKSQSSNSKSSEEEKPKAREGSPVKSSGTTPEPKKEKHKESGKSSNTASKSKESVDEDSDAKALKHITKGVINAEEYEPEEKGHKGQDSKDEDDDGTRRSRRFKRQAFTLKKRYRGKKFSSGSKKVTTKYRRSIV